MAGALTMANALLSLLQGKSPASTYVKTTNSNARGDTAVYDSYDPVVVIISPGTFSASLSTFDGQSERVHSLRVDVAARYSDASDAVTNLATTVEAIMETVEAWPKLNATAGARDAVISAGDDYAFLFAPNGSGPHFVQQTIRCQVTEDRSYTQQE